MELTWHFIGRLQANKTRAVAERFAWAHGVDRLRIAERLAAQRPAAMAPLNVCIEVKLADVAARSGVGAALKSRRWPRPSPRCRDCGCAG